VFSTNRAVTVASTAGHSLTFWFCSRIGDAE
jgi:hypothetical protein